MLYLRGLALYDQDQFPRAVGDFKMALDKEPTPEQLHQM